MAAELIFWIWLAQWEFFVRKSFFAKKNLACIFCFFTQKKNNIEISIL
jgi:hypothetical protein